MTDSKGRLICFYSVSAQLGGAERSLLEFLVELQGRDDHDYRTWVLLPVQQGPLIERLHEAGIEVTSLEMPRALLKVSRNDVLSSVLNLLRGAAQSVRYFILLSFLLRDRKPLLIHTTGLKCHLFGALVGRAVGIPVLWHVRDIFKRGPVRTLLRVCARVSGIHWVANSQATLSALGLRPQRDYPHVIYNGLPSLLYYPRPAGGLRARFQIPEKSPVIGLLGVLARWKGQIEFIRMAAAMVSRGSPGHFFIGGARIYDTTGDRNYEARLHALVEKLGLRGRVHFSGFQTHSRDFLNELDVLVHASIAPEPFGRVVLEAMACGIPVVATTGGGIDEFVRDGHSGLLVQPGNVDEMASAVQRLLDDPQFSETLVSHARATFLQDFTIERHRENILKVYASLLDRSELRPLNPQGLQASPPDAGPPPRA